MQTSAYGYLLKHILPYIRLTTYYTSFRGNQFYEGYKRLRPGDIILTHDKKKLTGLLIPGTVDHAALCVGRNGKDYEIIEMTHEDFKPTWFFDICKESDRVIILRCYDFDFEYIHRMIQYAWTLNKAKYDGRFKLGVKELYCSELIYEADFERRLKVDLSDLLGLGQPYISPEGLLKAKNAYVVFDSKSI